MMNMVKPGDFIDVDDWPCLVIYVGNQDQPTVQVMVLAGDRLFNLHLQGELLLRQLPSGM